MAPGDEPALCWSATQLSGERKAILELAAADDRWKWAPSVQYGWQGRSFVIESTELS